MGRVGIGGYFLRAADLAGLGAWCREYLGLSAYENGLWRLGVVATFESETEYFGLARSKWMVSVDCTAGSILREFGSSSRQPPDRNV
jgi:hypothetical protein